MERSKERCLANKPGRFVDFARHFPEETLAPFSREAKQLRDGLWGLDVSELVCSFPNCPHPTTAELDTKMRSGDPRG